jgi:hypothetical protein
MLGSDHKPAALLLDGYNFWPVLDDANTLGGRDLLDQRNDRTPNLRVFDTSVCLYQRDPVGCREKSPHVTCCCRPAFREFRQMKLARRPLKEKRHRYAEDV